MHKRMRTIVLVPLFMMFGQPFAADYPSRPIRIIVAQGPGSPGDLSVRTMASELGAQLGQQIVVDNRPGGSGIIGYEMIARAAPDGYTVGYLSSIVTVTPSLFSKLPFDVSKNYQPIVLTSSIPSLLVVTPSQPIRSIKELIAHARARPGTLSYGGVGIGGGMHLAMALFETATGTNMLYVVYKGSQQVLTDVIGGQIQLAWDPLSSTVPHVQAGRVRALGVSSLKRSSAIPEVPTVDEAGVPGYEFSTWGGYALPAGAPRAALARLNAEINKALAKPSIAKVIIDRGGTPIGGTPEHFAEHLKRETVKWAGVIKAAGIKPQ